ncbi:MAG: hypothetical protein Q8R30_00325 [bacterium]|nr:hypothetical protein [bacterium]
MTPRSVSIVLGMVLVLVSVLWMARPSVKPIKNGQPAVVKTVGAVRQANVVRVVTSEEVTYVRDTFAAKDVREVRTSTVVEERLRAVGMTLQTGHEISVR